MHPLPRYQPPSDQRASAAAALAPLLVLFGFASIVTKVIEPSTGLALFLACAIWVAHELHQYQRSIDNYNHDYVQRHLERLSSEALVALVEVQPCDEPTREFVLRFLGAGRKAWRDGPTL